MLDRSENRQPITLEQFVAGTHDRDESPIFAGREAELDWLGEQVQLMRGVWRARGEVAGSIRTVTGCPGIGKTALMREFGMRCEADYLVVRADLDDFLSYQTWHAVSTAQLKTGKVAEKKGVVLLFDEAQNLRPEHAGGVSFLHTGSGGLPVFPVFFGLSDTPQSLRRAGALRVPHGLRLRPLPDRESETLFENFEHAFGESVPATLRNRLLRDSQGVPQHLNSALRTFGGEVLRNRGHGTGIDSCRVLTRALELREAYYSDRLASVEGGPVSLAVELADKAGKNGMDREDVEQAARDGFRDMGLIGPDPFAQSRAFVKSLVRCGVLSPQTDGAYEVPIPSFLTWLQENHLGKSRSRSSAGLER